MGKMTMDAAKKAVEAAISRIRAEQTVRGKKPSAEVQLALRAAQQAGHWLAEAEKADTE